LYDSCLYASYVHDLCLKNSCLHDLYLNYSCLYDSYLNSSYLHDLCLKNSYLHNSYWSYFYAYASHPCDSYVYHTIRICTIHILYYVISIHTIRMYIMYVIHIYTIQSVLPVDIRCIYVYTTSVCVHDSYMYIHKFVYVLRVFTCFACRESRVTLASFICIHTRVLMANAHSQAAHLSKHVFPERFGFFIIETNGVCN
jgi:hypothetical protein